MLYQGKLAEEKRIPAESREFRAQSIRQLKSQMGLTASVGRQRNVWLGAEPINLFLTEM